MKATTFHRSYLAGCVKGDGWVSPLTVGLRVKDKDFADSFSDSLNAIFGVHSNPRRDERRYWLVRVGNKTGRFNDLITFQPCADDQKRAWLMGMFDSEGNAQLTHRPKVSPGAYQRRVAFYSTCVETVETLERFLADLGFLTKTGEVKATKGHLGTKVVYEVRLRASQAAYKRFAAEVGSSIGRKQTTLDAIPASYQPPGHHARMQEKGAATRRARRDAGGSY